MGKINSNRRDISLQLIKLIGGNKNIIRVSHCLTRLRFELNDPLIADVEAIKQLSPVKGCFTQAGQFQIIIGTDVSLYYQALLPLLTPSSTTETAQTTVLATNYTKKKSSNRWQWLLSSLAEIFVPLLPALIAGGLLLGLRNLIGEMPIIDDQPLIKQYQWLQPVYSFLWLPCEAIFHFLPVAICWSTVRKIGGSPVLGIVLGITLVSPQLMNAYNLGSQIPDFWDFGWFQIDKVGYQAQVIPSIFAGITLGWLEINLKKMIPSALHLVIVPIVALLGSLFLAHIVLGPFGRWLGEQIASIVTYLMTGSIAPIGSAVFGFVYAPLVITGIHHTLLAVDMQMTSSFGGTPIWPIIALSNIAQASAVVGIILINKSTQEREITIPAAISAYLGVTEPAMYGVNLPYRYPMLSAMFSTACAGLLCGLSGVLSNGIGVGGLPGILSIQPAFWGTYAIAMLIAIILPIILTMLFYHLKIQRATSKSSITIKGAIQ